MCGVKRFCLYIIILLTVKVYSQELYFNNIGPLQGLSSSQTYQTLQDSKGFIWITTDAGLCRYDGNTIITYTVKDGISENVVFGAYEDQHGRVWFNSISGYFFYYEKGKFHSISANQELKKICGTYFINSFFIGENDTLYCSVSTSVGILKIPPQNNYKTVIKYRGNFCSGNRFIIANKINHTQTMMGAGKQEMNNKDSVYLAYCFNKTVSVSFKKASSHAGNTWIGKCDNRGNVFMPTGKQMARINRSDSAVEYYNFPNDIMGVNVDRMEICGFVQIKAELIYLKMPI